MRSFFRRSKIRWPWKKSFTNPRFVGMLSLEKNIKKCPLCRSLKKWNTLLYITLVLEKSSWKIRDFWSISPWKKFSIKSTVCGPGTVKIQHLWYSDPWFVVDQLVIEKKLKIHEFWTVDPRKIFFEFCFICYWNNFSKNQGFLVSWSLEKNSLKIQDFKFVKKS